MYVYLVTNTNSGKKYVGKTIRSVASRWKNHIADSKRCQTALARAIRKYGSTSFSVRTLSVALNESALIALELFWIRELKTKTPYGYNLTDGGEGAIGFKHSADEVKKMRRPRSPEGLIGLRLAAAARRRYVGADNPNYGKRHSSETLRKISESRKGKRTGPDHPLYGKHHSEATRTKMRKPKSEIGKQNMRDGWARRNARLANAHV